MIKVFQNRTIVENARVLNGKSINQLDEPLASAVKHSIELSIRGSKAFSPDMCVMYKHVADVYYSDSLTQDPKEFVFEVLNGYGDCQAKIVRHSRMSSLSVGDIIQTNDGKFFMVDGVGFTEVDTKDFFAE